MIIFFPTILFLIKKYKCLKSDYNLLRRYYNDLLAEKESYNAQREELREKIAACAGVLNRPLSAPVAENASSENTVPQPAVPPGFENI